MAQGFGNGVETVGEMNDSRRVRALKVRAQGKGARMSKKNPSRHIDVLVAAGILISSHHNTMALSFPWKRCE